jgi:hypothetical protein
MRVLGTIDFDLPKADLAARLAANVSGSDLRADIVIQQSPDSLDQTQFAAERDLAVSLLNRETQMSRRIQAALRRMEIVPRASVSPAKSRSARGGYKLCHGRSCASDAKGCRSWRRLGFWALITKKPPN